jgi:hypothetical protein
MELPAQSHRIHEVVVGGKPFQIPQALTEAQDPELLNQQHVPGRYANAAPYARVQDRP